MSLGGRGRGRIEEDCIYLCCLLCRLDSRSLFLMDTGPHIMIYVGTNVNPHLVQQLFGKRESKVLF